MRIRLTPIALVIALIVGALLVRLPGCKAFESTEPLEASIADKEAILDAKIGDVAEVRDQARDEGDFATMQRAEGTIAVLTAARDEARQVRLDLESARIQGPPPEVGLILGFLPPQVAAVLGTGIGVGAAAWQAFRRWQAILRAKQADADADSIIRGVEKAKALDAEFKAKLKAQRPVLIETYTNGALERVGRLAG